MPLDETTWKPEIETKPNLSKPSLEGLSYALRHLEEVLGTWEYQHERIENHCGTAGCAWGVARRLWPVETNAHTFESCWASANHLFGHDAYARFFLERAYDIHPAFVTAKMVADRIDAYLAETRK